jgi:hypothetical protein
MCCGCCCVLVLGVTFTQSPGDACHLCYILALYHSKVNYKYLHGSCNVLEYYSAGSRTFPVAVTIP